MIRLSLPGDREALIELYKRCFEDGLEGVSAVFEGIWRPFETLIFEENQRVLSMVMLPRFFMKHTNTHAGYVYALCTDPDCRGKGIMTKLLNAAHEHCEARGDGFTFLVPASESLFSLYSRFSYESAIFIKNTTVPAALPSDTLRNATVSDYPYIISLYEISFSGGDFITRDVGLCKTLDAIYRATGGGFYLNNEGYVLLEGPPTAPTVREAGAETNQTRLISSAAASLGLPELNCRLPAASGTPYGCIRNIKGIDIKKPVFYNLMFD